MSLESYLAKARGFDEEILSDFSDEQIEQLYTRLSALSMQGYVSFVRSHQTEIVQYIELTPSQRCRAKWLNHPDILLIRLAAYQISSITDVFLTYIENLNSLAQYSGVSYRKFHASLSEHLSEMAFSRYLTLFPFDGYESPFLK